MVTYAKKSRRLIYQQFLTTLALRTTQVAQPYIGYLMQELLKGDVSFSHVYFNCMLSMYALYPCSYVNAALHPISPFKISTCPTSMDVIQKTKHPTFISPNPSERTAPTSSSTSSPEQHDSPPRVRVQTTLPPTECVSNFILGIYWHARVRPLPFKNNTIPCRLMIKRKTKTSLYHREPCLFQCLATW